ncbi:MAG: class I SAM-dependent methyltransferase [Pyrinomonadaceae bacterium]|nr:class I SAM-dependent methyltransferase [Acidobacteriota bacterium]MBP7375770.1 class I SAM-dependent methyltransferase [Pyrinomonadaceae bacterium]
MEIPFAMAHPAIYETVERILGPMPRGRLLDVPSGRGALAEGLIKMGFEVSCADLYPEIFQLENVEILKGDLDGKLPYKDDSFDYIVCIEGLEHIENPANAIREFSRVLKSGGTLIASVPNIMNIEERLRWLFSGYTSHFKPLSSDVQAEYVEIVGSMEEIAFHINPIGYSEMRYLLEKSGLSEFKLHLDKAKKNSWRFLPLTALIRLSTRFSSEAKRRRRWANELNSNEVLLGGNTLIFEAKKQ